MCRVVTARGSLICILGGILSECYASRPVNAPNLQIQYMANSRQLSPIAGLKAVKLYEAISDARKAKVATALMVGPGHSNSLKCSKKELRSGWRDSDRYLHEDMVISSVAYGKMCGEIYHGES